jgi:transketolase
LFEEKFPERFIECFIAEQNMVNMAIGFTTQGFTPFVSTFACFFTRAFDQLRMAAIGRDPLRLVGSHAGVSVGQDGPSQMGLEDMAMISSLPGAVILYPSDAYSCAQLVHQMVHYTENISYLRTTREELPNLSDSKTKITIGGSRIVWKSVDSKLTIVAAGITVHEALKAAVDLRQHGIEITVIDAYTVQPLDVETIMSVIAQTGYNVIVVEDHYPSGGLGGAVLEYLAEDYYSFTHLCVRDFPRSGTPQELRERAGIDAKAIKNAVADMLGLKKLKKLF